MWRATLARWLRFSPKPVCLSAPMLHALLPPRTLLVTPSVISTCHPFLQHQLKQDLLRWERVNKEGWRGRRVIPREHALLSLLPLTSTVPIPTQCYSVSSFPVLTSHQLPCVQSAHAQLCLGDWLHSGVFYNMVCFQTYCLFVRNRKKRKNYSWNKLYFLAFFHLKKSLENVI